MGDLTSSILQAAGANPNDYDQSTGNQSYGTPAKLLDNLETTESSGDPYAVNKDTGAMGAYQFMPDTVSMLHKQGIKFNPFDRAESRSAADQYISQLAQQNGGDYTKAMTAYGGFKTKDPSAYLSKVLNGVDTSGQQAPQGQPQGQSAPTDPNAFSVDSIMQAAKSAEAPAVKNIADMTDAEYAAYKAQNPAPMKVDVAGTRPGGQTALSDQIPGGPGQVVPDQPPESITDKLKGAGEAALATGTGMAAGPIGALAGLGYGLTHDYGSAQGAKNAGDVASNVSDKLTYSPSTQAGQRYTQNISDAFNNSGVTGLAPISEMATLGHLAPGAIDQLKSGPQGVPLNDITQGRVEPTVGKPAYRLVDGKAVPINQIEAPLQDVGSATKAANQEPIAGNQPKPEPMYASGSAPANASEMSPNDRAAVLQRIGLPTARASVIDNNPMQSATEAQMAKFNEPAGLAAKDQFTAERTALQNHAANIVEGTGGTLGTDDAALYSRGTDTDNYLNSLKGWYKNKVSDLYQKADSISGGVPANMPETHQFIGGDKAEFLGTTEGESLLKGVTARMKSLGMTDDNGNPQPVSVKQAEQLKQYLGNQWQPRTSRLISGMKNAIDNDVFSNAGQDVYGEARSLRAQQANTIDNPKGISKIMDSSGPEGINRAVPIEKIPDTIANLPIDQFSHIIKTIDGAPPELQTQAANARTAIQSHFANKLLDAGNSNQASWNNAAVAKYMKANSEKMKMVFTPEEFSKIQDLHDAGNILQTDHSYPGAAAQAVNSLKSGLMTRALPRAGMMLGGGMGGAFGFPGTGAMIGNALGSKAARSMGEGKALKKFNKGTTNLSGFP